MNVTINIVELASDLAAIELEKDWTDSIRIFEDDEEASKEEYSKVKAIIVEMLLKAIPKELATESQTLRLDGMKKEHTLH